MVRIYWITVLLFLVSLMICTLTMHSANVIRLNWPASATNGGGGGDPPGFTAAVSYDGNYNTGGTAPTDPNSPYEVDDTVTVLGNTGLLTKTYYNFANWNTASDGSGDSYSQGDTFTAVFGTTVLYAQWSQRTVLDLQGNGTDEDTTTTDSSPSAHTVILDYANGCKLDDAHKESGATSILLANNGITVDDSTDFDLQNQSTFQIRLWCYKTINDIVFKWEEDGSNKWGLTIGYYGVTWAAYDGGTLTQNAAFDFSALGQGFFLTASREHEIIFTHNSEGETLFVDGFDLTFTLDTGTRTWTAIGALTAPALYITGTSWVDNVRISSGCDDETPMSVPAGAGWYCTEANAMDFTSEDCSGLAPGMTQKQFSYTTLTSTACVPQMFGPGTSGKVLVVYSGPYDLPSEVPSCGGM